jgi:hypothetical protein
MQLLGRNTDDRDFLDNAEGQLSNQCGLYGDSDKCGCGKYSATDTSAALGLSEKEAAGARSMDDGLPRVGSNGCDDRRLCRLQRRRRKHFSRDANTNSNTYPGATADIQLSRSHVDRAVKQGRESPDGISSPIDFEGRLIAR